MARRTRESAAAKSVTIVTNGESHSSETPKTPEKDGNKETATTTVPPPVRRPRLFPNLRRRRSTSEPPPPKPRLMVADHFRMERNNENERPHLLPGVPRYEEDWARDCHDYFNLIILVPVIFCNVLNWHWDGMLQAESFADAWTGDWFFSFFYITLFYFVVDLLWIINIPQCVKSPGTIVQHHAATILYILIPYHVPRFRWAMGACMSVELNTWFLIARRVLNKQGFSPWTTIDLSIVSIRVKLVSLFFYITWISIRCVLYPALMMPFYRCYQEHSIQTGTRWNVVMWSVPLHAAFCVLNLKWTYDLIMSKIRYFRRKARGEAVNNTVSKGL